MQNLKFVEIQLTQGNLDNNHLYLTSVMGFFPSDSVGGSNINDEATTKLELHSGIDEPVLTDIAGDKNIFRKRSWVRNFFEAHNLSAGDRVIIEKTDVNRYHIFPVRS